MKRADGGSLQEAGEVGRSILGGSWPGSAGVGARYGRFGLGIISKVAGATRHSNSPRSKPLFSFFLFQSLELRRRSLGSSGCWAWLLLKHGDASQ